MQSNQTLTKQVLFYLKDKYSIKLDLPLASARIVNQTHLKFFKSPLGDKLEENRYKMLITFSQELLKKNIINTEKIKEFGEIFFQIINQDILVLQNNQKIRQNFSKIRDQITYRIQELSKQQQSIEEECKSINDKQDILTFLQGSFKNYLQNVKVVSEHYEDVNNVQVYTSLNIDNLYQDKLAQEQDYLQHYGPLLQVMLRFKSNMIKLYQELNKCDFYDLPLKSVNFLANCKNLLLELEAFLIRDDCAFNRLIFHVTKGQKENNTLITSAFQSNLNFTNEIISDVFKSFYLAYIFQDYFRDIKSKIQNQKEEIIKIFESKHVNSANFDQYFQKQKAKCEDILVEIKKLKSIVGTGRDKIMHEYVSKKQCKKYQKVVELKNQAKELIKMIQRAQKYCLLKEEFHKMKDRTHFDQNQIQKIIILIQQSEKQGTKHPKISNYTIEYDQMTQQIESSFKESFILIQNGFLRLSNYSDKLSMIKQQEQQEYWRSTFFPQQQTQINDLLQKYRQFEIELLNSFQSLRKQNINKQSQANELKARTTQKLSEFFNDLDPIIGSQIKNEDASCEQTKEMIIQVQKVQYMLKNFAKQKKDQFQELNNYKYNLEWLLQVYQGSMDEKILQNFVAKMNFEAQDWIEKQDKIQQLTKELHRYVSTLKSILKTDQISIMHQNVFKLIKKRIQLYQIISDMYEQFLLIFKETKKQGHLNIADHGLKLFDDPTYKYVLMIYQFSNKIRAEIAQLKELLLPSQTINYLIDEIYTPFIQNYKNYISFDEQTLRNFTLRLQHSLNYKLSHDKIFQMFEETLKRPYNKDYFSNVARICQQIIELQQQNQKILDLEQEEVMIYNLSEYKQLIKKDRDHFELANCILRDIKVGKMELDCELTNPNLIKLKQIVIQNWNKEDIEEIAHSPHQSRLSAQN